MKRCDCGFPAVVKKGRFDLCEVCAGIEAHNNPHPLQPTPRRGFSHLLKRRLVKYMDLYRNPSHRRLA